MDEKIEYAVFIIHKLDEVLLLINGTSAVFLNFSPANPRTYTLNKYSHFFLAVMFVIHTLALAKTGLSEKSVTNRKEICGVSRE